MTTKDFHGVWCNGSARCHIAPDLCFWDCQRSFDQYPGFMDRLELEKQLWHHTYCFTNTASIGFTLVIVTYCDCIFVNFEFFDSSKGVGFDEAVFWPRVAVESQG